MKIYFIGQKGIPTKFGGVERHVEELSARLVKAGHEVYVYVRPSYTDPKLTKHKGVNLICLSSVATKHLDAISHTFRACLDVIKRDADVIHFHSIGPSSLLWLVKLLKPGVPVVSTFHSMCYFHQKWGWFARAYLKFGEMVACVVADATIAISKSLTDYAKKTYGREAIYIPNGVGLAEYMAPNEIKQWGLTRGNYILSVSRLVRHKGIHYLIEAYNRLKTDKKLVIVGEGAFTDDYIKELKLLAEGNKNIIFTGSKNGNILQELFSNAYLFVQPSESEGLSIALLEAMSYGKTALVSDIPENMEAINNTGLVFKNKDADDLSEKLKYSLENELIVKIQGSLGRERAKEHYNWEAITADVIKVYNQVIIAKENRFLFKKYRLVKKFVSFIF